MKQQRPLLNDFYDILESPLGPLCLIYSSNVLTGISFSRPPNFLLKRKEGMTQAKKELSRYFEKALAEVYL